MIPGTNRTRDIINIGSPITLEKRTSRYLNILETLASTLPPPLSAVIVDAKLDLWALSPLYRTSNITIFCSNFLIQY
jgi:hypothetical protein